MREKRQIARELVIQSDGQRRYKGVRIVRSVRLVRGEDLPFLLRNLKKS